MVGEKLLTSFTVIVFMIRALPSLFIVLVLIIISGTRGVAQSEARKEVFQISGVVWDANTYQPLPFSHIYTLRDGTLANEDGQYKIQTYENEVLRASYLGYESQEIVVSGKSEYHFFWLKPLIVKLEEVVIRPFHTEEEMKAILLQTATITTNEKLNARQNLINLNKHYLGGYRPEMNSLDNYLNYMRGPQGVSILSTNPNKGLFKWWKNAKRK